MDERGKGRDAFDGYKELLERYPNYMPYDRILTRMFELAVSAMDHRKAKIIFGGFKAPTRAVPLFETIVELGPEWKHAPEAQYLIGKAYEEEGDYLMAVVSYASTQYRYPNSEYAEKAAFSRAYGLVRMSERNPNDRYNAQEAWAALTYFITQYPLSSQLEDMKILRRTIHENLAEATYREALFYDKDAHKPKAALIAYRRFIQQFPSSRWTPVAEKRIEELKKTITEQDHDEKE